jgi:hypothetical protein
VNGIATATKSAVATMSHFITGVTVSASDLPTGAVQVQILNGVTVLDQWEIPAAQFAPIPINFVRPYACSPNADAKITLSALGAGVRGTVVLRGFTSTP